MSSALPWITVVVPTRSRLDTLRECLRTILEQSYPRLRVLVSDNQSDGATVQYLGALRDERLHHVRTPRALSMASNYEFALEHLPSREGFVMVLGDDDGLVPGAIARAATLLANTGTRALRSLNCSYTWPSFHGTSYGRLGVPLGTRVEERDSLEWLGRVMACEASYHELPMLYQGGVIEISLLDEIKARSGGRFYRSCIPDVYSAMAISSVVGRYVFTHEPLAINGLSGHSIGMSQGRDRFKEGSAARRFQQENEHPFHPDIPLREDGDYPVGQGIVYEPFLQSAHLRAVSITSHDEQLVLILASMHEDQREIIRPWAMRFALQNGLEFATAERSAARRRPLFVARRVSEGVVNATFVAAFGSESLPLRTVFDASTAAGTMLASRSVTANVWRRARQLGARFIKPSS